MGRVSAPWPWYSGWLLFTGQLGAEYTITGDTCGIEVGMDYDSSGNRVRLKCELYRPVFRKEPYPGASLWPALQTWETPDRRFPPDILALRELVRRHQAEFDDIRESEAVLRALGG
jgi:hypothetical protein